MITLTPTAGGTINDIIADMGTYGITVYANGVDIGQSNGQAWTLQELQELQEAIRDVARVFNQVKYSADSIVSPQARNLFRNVMKQVNSGVNLKFLRVTNDFTFGNGDACDGSSNEACTSNGNTAIALYGNFALGGTGNANYTIVHELGHRFDNQN